MIEPITFSLQRYNGCKKRNNGLAPNGLIKVVFKKDMKVSHQFYYSENNSVDFVITVFKENDKQHKTELYASNINNALPHQVCYLISRAKFVERFITKEHPMTEWLMWNLDLLDEYGPVSL